MGRAPFSRWESAVATESGAVADLLDRNAADRSTLSFFARMEAERWEKTSEVSNDG